MRKTWKMMKRIGNLATRQKPIKSIILNNIEITNNSEIAEIFNDYFHNVPIELESNLPPSTINPLVYLGENSYSSMFMTPVTESECLSIISRLKIQRKQLIRYQ